MKKINLFILSLIISTMSIAQSSVYDFSLKSIDGKPLSLSKFKGKKMLLVNVASNCGYTGQYKELQELHEKFGSKIAVLGFPANNFGSQEPGTNGEIATFCQKNYGVGFQMFEKISVKGSDSHPLYKYLSEQSGESPGWNFCKYLIDENGKIIKFYSSGTSPMSTEITSKL